jgi:hypothetical protein
LSIEQPLVRDRANPARQADILLANFDPATNRAAALDVAVVSPLRNTLINQAVGNPQHAQAVAADAKRRKYRGSIPENVTFIPMVVDTFGNWSTEARDVLKRLAVSVATHRGLKEGPETAAFFARLAMVLLRHNAWALLDRSPGRRPDYFDDLN